MKNFAVIESILRNRLQFFTEVREGVGLPDKIRAMFISASLSWPSTARSWDRRTAWRRCSARAAKLPVLFLATMIICAPSLYFFNVLFGSKQSLSQNIALTLTAITVTGVLLLSFAPIVLFFLLTTSQYQFFKLLNVGVFVIAGVTGMVFLVQGMRIVSADSAEGADARHWVLRLWILVYAFVGSQMAWTLRPYIGFPGAPFELIRQLGGNFYTDIFASIGEFLGLLIVR
jgi:hypothetical protein